VGDESKSQHELKMDIRKIEKNGKIFMIAYDQGMEHGPTDFNNFNYHPNYILKIAENAGASCVAMGYGLAKAFYSRKSLPLILKLNGKTNLYTKNTRSALIANVEDARRLGAVGVGYTIFPGQAGEAEGFAEFAQIRREAEKRGMITILWSYARGPEIKDQYATDVVAYAARVAAELGADAVKVKYTGDADSFRWVVKCAAGTRVLISGTDNFPDDYLQGLSEAMKSGASGIAVGRKVWQDERAEELGKKIASKVYNS